MTSESYAPSQPVFGAIARSFAAVPAWVWCGAGLMVAATSSGDGFLRDADTYWQIAVGQGILATGTFPTVDTYSFTRTGAPWVSSSWLSQVLFAGGYAVAGWAGPVLLTALAIAATFAQLVRLLSRRFEPSHAVLIGMTALTLCYHHFFARPHILAMPVMVAWVGALTAAANRRGAPSFWLLPLMTLWANLHGGFVLGLALVAPFAFDALWSAARDERKALLGRWVLFGLGATVAACLTPYGWGSLLSAFKILDLGAARSLIPEWRSATFEGLNVFEVCLLIPLAAALLRGISLPLPRVLLLVGFVHMALAHNRNFEVYALLVPLILAAPIATQLASKPRSPSHSAWYAPAFVVAACTMALSAAFVAAHPFQFTVQWTPAAAVNVLRAEGAKRILNEPSFGGYLITQGVPTFIDGRAELYGETFIVETLDALALRDLGGLVRLLDAFKIDATLLPPSSSAVQALDLLGWRRVYTDTFAVVHRRVTAP